MVSSQPNLVIDSGVNSSLHKNCDHEIIYAKFNFKIYSPPPYEREPRIIKKQTENNRKAIDEFLWAIYMGFTYIDVNEKVNLFNKTIKK